MKVVCFCPAEEIVGSIEKRFVLEAFAEGVRANGVKAETVLLPEERDCDLAVLWGVSGKARRRVIDRQESEGRPYVVIERGFLRRESYYSVGFGGICRRAVFRNKDRGKDRWDRLGIDLARWREGTGVVLIAGQVAGDANLAAIGPGYHEWLEDLAAKIAGLSRSAVRFRPHPLGTIPSLASARTSSPNRTLSEDLEECSVLVTFNSNSAVEAVVRGVPVITFDEGSMAWEVSGHDLNRVDSPELFARQQWANDLAYAQWTLEELRSGEAWSFLTRPQDAEPVSDQAITIMSRDDGPPDDSPGVVLDCGGRPDEAAGGAALAVSELEISGERLRSGALLLLGIAEGGEESHEVLHAALREKSRDIVRCALVSLGKFGESVPQVLPEIFRIWNSPDYDEVIKAVALISMAKIGPSDLRVRELVADGLDHSHKVVRRAAWQSLTHHVADGRFALGAILRGVWTRGARKGVARNAVLSICRRWAAERIPAIRRELSALRLEFRYPLLLLCSDIDDNRSGQERVGFKTEPAGDHLEALLNSGDLRSSIALFKQIVEGAPDDYEAINALGVLFYNSGLRDRATECFEEVVKMAPDFAEGRCNLADCLFSHRHNAREAMMHYQQAKDLKPSLSAAWDGASMVFRDSKRWKEALECGSEACRCPDANRWTFHSYADTLSKLERNREAAEVLIGAIALDPSPFLFAKLGFQFLQLRRDHDAEFVLGLVTDLKPGDTNARNVFANVLLAQGRQEEALRAIDAGLEHDRQSSPLRFLRSLVLLNNRDFERGWCEYEWRLCVSSLPEWLRRVGIPHWQGGPLEGKSLLVVSEQGIGDEILFSTQYCELAQSGGEVTVVCNKRLVGLFERSFPSIQVVPASKAEALVRERHFDLMCFSGSLARCLRPNLGSFVRGGAHLKADPSRIAPIRERYENKAHGRLIVGISWESHSHNYRSMKCPPMDLWRQILSTAGVFFVNLQYGDSRKSLDPLAAELGVGIFDDDIDPKGNLDIFASQVRALDAVVTVSNATFHLSGGLGVPTSLLLPRFLGTLGSISDGKRNLWYESVEVFRQASGEDWLPLFASVSEALNVAVRKKMTPLVLS